MKVMVVGTNFWLRARLVILLRYQPGIDMVAAAGSSRKAARLAREYQPQVTVMDVSEPGLDEIEAMRQIRAAYGDARVILLSNCSTPENVHTALQAGAMGYVLMKESAADDIVAAVRSVAKGKCYLDQNLRDGSAPEA